MKPENLSQQQRDEEIKERVEVEVPGFKFGFDSNDGWKGIAMAVVLVLSIVAGVKLIMEYL